MAITDFTATVSPSFAKISTILPLGRGGDFGVDFVGGNFQDRFVFAYNIPGILEPLEDCGFGD